MQQGLVCWIKEENLGTGPKNTLAGLIILSQVTLFHIFHHTSETRVSFFNKNLTLHKKPVRIPLLYSLLICFSEPCSLEGKFIFLWLRMVVEGILRDNTFVLKGCACLCLFSSLCGFHLHGLCGL